MYTFCVGSNFFIYLYYTNNMSSKLLQRNTLLRYKNIRDLYLKHKTPDIPDTVILRNYIYPLYPICRTTLNTVLSCPIDKYLNETNNHSDQLNK